MSVDPEFDVSLIGFDDGRRALVINAGRREVRRVVPPSGEDHAFDAQEWARHVEVYVSRTGRSVRVWVDGNEVDRG